MLGALRCLHNLGMARTNSRWVSGVSTHHLPTHASIYFDVKGGCHAEYGLSDCSGPLDGWGACSSKSLNPERAGKRRRAATPGGGFHGLGQVLLNALTVKSSLLHPRQPSVRRESDDGTAGK